MALLDPKRYRAAQTEAQNLRDLQQRNRDKLNFQRYQSDISKNIADPNIIKAKEQPKTLDIIPKFPDSDGKLTKYGTDTKLAEWEAEQNRIKTQNYDEFGNRLDVPASAEAVEIVKNQMRNLGKLYDETKAHKAGISGGQVGLTNFGFPFFDPIDKSFGEFIEPNAGPTRWLYDKDGRPISFWGDPDRARTLAIWAKNLGIQTLPGQKDPRTDMEYDPDLLPPDERNVLATIRQKQRTEDLIAEREREAAISKPSEIETILDMAPGPIRTSHLNEYIEKNKDIVKTIVKDKGLLEKMTDAEFGFNDELIENPEFKKVLQAEVAKREGKLPVYDKFLNVEPAGAGKLTQDALDVRAGKVTQIQTLTQHANVAKLQGNQAEFNRLQILISEATQKLKLDDHNIVHLQGMQSLANLDGGDTGLASAVWSEYTGRNIRIIPRTDGYFDVEDNGKIVLDADGKPLKKVSKKDLKDNLRLKFDSVWKTKLAEEQFRRNKLDYDAQVERGTTIVELNVKHLTELMKKKMDLKIAEAKAQKDTIHFEDDGVFKTDVKTGVVYQMHEREYEDPEGETKIDAYWKAIRTGPNSGLNLGEVTAFDYKDYKDAVKETTNQPGLSITME